MNSNLDNPLVSIVFVCWNRKEEVLDTLKHLTQIEYNNYEIIVIDNASTDGTFNEVKNNFPKVKIKRLKKNIGITAYNIGFQMAKGEYIVVLDDDSYLEKNSLTILIDKFKKLPEDVAIINFQVINTHNYKSATLMWPKYIISFWGCGAGIRKKFIEKIGGYDENIFLYRNELEMGLRAIKNGYKVIHDDEIIVYHKIEPKRYLNKRTFYYSTVNDIYLIYKYFPFKYVFDHYAYLFLRTLFKSFYYDEYLFFKIWKDAFNKIKRIKRTVINDKKVIAFVYNKHNKKYLPPRLTDMFRL